MVEKIKKWCDCQELIKNGDTILIACSGGPDSLALTDIFCKLKNEYELKLAVAHLDHMIRGEESKADAKFVKEFCKQRDIIYFEKSVDVPAYAQKYSLSTEDAARSVRYQFLREVAKKLGGAKIATGHHKDDQAETVLLHLLRGAGSSGIGGIRPLNCGIIRPLLSVSRAEIEKYCQEMNLRPRIDATNLVPFYLRNKVRLQLLPELEKEYNPAIKEALCRSGELIGTEHQFIRAYTENYFDQFTKFENEKIIFQKNELGKLHLAIKRELFRLAIEKIRGHLKEISFFHIEQMIWFAENGKVRTVLELPGRLILKCGYDALELYYLHDKEIQPVKEFEPIRLMVPGKTEVPELGIVVETEIFHRYIRVLNRNQIICDMDKLNQPLYVRRRKPGDRFQPSGMNGSKKLKDFFIDCKIEQEKRNYVALFCSQEEIFWVGGLRQSQNSMVTSETVNFLILTIRQDERKKSCYDE